MPDSWSLLTGQLISGAVFLYLASYVATISAE